MLKNYFKNCWIFFVQVIPTNRPTYATDINDQGTLPTPQTNNFEKISVNKFDNEQLKSTPEISESSLLDNLTVSKNLETSIDKFLTRVKNTVDLNAKRINPGLKKDVSSERKQFFNHREANSTQSDANDMMKNVYMKNCDMVYKRQYYDSVLNFQRAKGKN